MSERQGPNNVIDAINARPTVYEPGPPNELYIREYVIPPEIEAQLTPQERRTLDELVSAIRLVAEPYRQQASDGKTTFFYPEDATKKEIREAAKRNPEILSPYTIVRRDTEDGSLHAVPMHLFYSDFLHKENGVIDHLRRAAELAEEAGNKQLNNYLRAKIHSLETGNYEAAEEAWLTMSSEPNLDIVIGFYDVYADRRFKKKNALTGWGGVKNEQVTNFCQSEVARYLNWYANTTSNKPPIVIVRADETVITAGQPAQFKWNGNSLPNQPELRKKFGSKFTLFLPPYRDSLAARLETYKSLVNANTRRRLPLEVLLEGDLRRINYHETTHSFDIPEDLPDKMEQHTDWIKEMYCDLMPIRGISQMKGITMRDREAIIATLFANGAMDYKDYREQGARLPYLKSRSMALAVCLEKESVFAEDGSLHWDEPLAMIGDIDALLEELITIMETGTKKDAENFLRRHYKPDTYQRVYESHTKIPGYLHKLDESDNPYLPVGRPQNTSN